jgi:hypothetical protein
MHAFVQAKVKGTSMTIRTHVQSIYLSVIRIGLSRFYGGFLRYTVRSFMELTLIDALIGIVLLNSETKNIKCIIPQVSSLKKCVPTCTPFPY